MTMSDRTYDALKLIAQLLLPALGTLYAALAGIWGFPMAEAVVGTLTAVDTFLGALLAWEKKKYDRNEKEDHE